MYKKIAIILVSFMPKSYLFTQGLILMFLSGVTYFITRIKEPFGVVSINNLENASNFSAFLIILVGNLSISNIQSNLKEILFIAMLFSSSCFSILWISSTFDIFLSQNSNFVKTKCFKFYVLYQTFLKIFKLANIESKKTKTRSFIDKIFLIYKNEKEKTQQEIINSSKITPIDPNNKKKKRFLQKAIKFLNEI